MSPQQANTAIGVYILDLDGTLIPSAEIDNRCFWQAVFSCLGKHQQVPDLHGFKNVTDSGILHEWCIRELGRPASADETRRIRLAFLALLKKAYRQQPEHFRPLAGLDAWLTAIAANRNACAGIATGGWGHTARLKLRLSGLDRFALPLASSDDANTRTRIMVIAARRTLAQAPGADAVYTCVGDGRWDLEASRALGWRFVGIASGAQADRLRKAGALQIRRDFTFQPGCGTD